MKGIPADILHAYVGPTATMQVRVASLVTIVNAHGPEMDQTETVTLLNDLCVLAPAALVDAPIEWTPIDDHQARATFTNAGHTVSAVLTFNDDHELVDFVSDDRLVSSADGRTFTPQRWSTPMTDYRSFDGRRLSAFGRARWHPRRRTQLRLPRVPHGPHKLPGVQRCRPDTGRESRSGESRGISEVTLHPGVRRIMRSIEARTESLAHRAGANRPPSEE